MNIELIIVGLIGALTALGLALIIPMAWWDISQWHRKRQHAKIAQRVWERANADQKLADLQQHIRNVHNEVFGQPKP